MYGWELKVGWSIIQLFELSLSYTERAIGVASYDPAKFEEMKKFKRGNSSELLG